MICIIAKNVGVLLLKKNIKIESDAISKIMELSPVNYFFTEASQKDLKTSDKFQHGLNLKTLTMLT